MMLQMMLRGETWSGDYEVTRRDGSKMWVFVTNTPMLGSRRMPSGCHRFLHRHHRTKDRGGGR